MNNFFLKKNIIITGATSGVGKSLSLMLGKHESNLLLVSKSEEKLLKLKNDIGNKLAKIEILGVDLSKNESPQKIYNFSSSHFKNIDIIINNAGIGYSSFVTEIDKDIAQEVFQVNFFSIVEINKLFLPSMIKKKQGSIINISSWGGKRSLPISSIYCASKSALEAYTESLRCELKTSNINVINIRPSVINDTNFFNGKFVKKEEFGSNIEKKIKEVNMISSDIVSKKILISIIKKHRDLNLTLVTKIMIILNSLVPGLIDLLVFHLRKKNIISNLRKIQNS